MEFKQYIKLIQKNLAFIAILIFVGLFLGLYSSRFFPSSYRQSQVLFVSDTQSINPEFNKNQERAINFTDTAASIIPSEDFLNSIQISQTSVDVKKLAPQVLKITTSSQSASKSKQDLETIVLKFNEKTENLTGDKSLQLKPVGVMPGPSHFVLDSKILAIFGAFIGLTVSVSIIALAAYFKF